MGVPDRNSEEAKWTGRVCFTSSKEAKLTRFIVYDQHPPSRGNAGLGFNFSCYRTKTAFKVGSGATTS
jgi:hypothetical protein